MEISISSAKQILNHHYHQCLEEIAKSKIAIDSANQKWEHSLQVIGAGNYLLRNQKEYIEEKEEFINICRYSIALHDLGRFKEISLANGFAKELSKHDHGIYSWEMLKDIYNITDQRILLSVKHHGHMIEELHNDEEFIKIKDEKLKQEILKVAAIVRDADKIANYHLFFKDAKIIYDINIDNFPESDKFSEVIWQQFINNEVCSYKHRKSYPDFLLCVLCWIFDIELEASFKFITKLNLSDSFINLLSEYIKDENTMIVIKNKVDTYISSKLDKNIMLKA